MLGCIVLLDMNPAGPVHTVFTITGISTNRLNSTVHISIMLDPTDWVALLVIITIAMAEDESGTEKDNTIIIGLLYMS